MTDYSLYSDRAYTQTGASVVGGDYSLVEDVSAVAGQKLKKITITEMIAAFVTLGSLVTLGGALGTPSSGTLTNATGLPLTTGVTGTLGATNGGTNFSTYATGDLIYASAANTLSKLPASSNGYVLTLAAGVPAWAASTGGVTSFSGGTTGLTPAGVTTGVITLAGTLAVANGGTGVTSSTGTGSVVLSASPTFTGTVTTGTLTATSAVDTILSSASTGTVQSGIVRFVGRQASVDNEWNWVAAGSGLTGAEARLVNGGWTGTAQLRVSTSLITLPIAINYGGVTLSNSVTGTGSMVLSASPTFTGTALAANITASGVVTASVATAENGMFVNKQTVAVDYTIATNYNAMSAGPVTVNSGITVTISSGSEWAVV